MKNNKFKKIIIKLMILFLAVFGGYYFTNQSQASSSDAEVEMTISSASDWADACIAVNSAEDCTYLLTLTSAFTCLSTYEMTITYSVGVRVYGQGYSISSYNSSSYNIFNLSKGSLRLYNVHLYSPQSPCVICSAQSTFIGNYLSMYDGASILNGGASTSEGAVHDNGYRLAINLYDGSIYSGFKATNSNSSLYIYPDSRYNDGNLSSSYENYTLKNVLEYRKTETSDYSRRDYYESGETITLTTNKYSNSGYTQTGWMVYEKKSLTSVSFSDAVEYTLGAEVTLDYPAYALPVYTVNTYTLTYDTNGGTYNYTNPVSFTVESSDITLKNPTKKGYDFAGWYLDEDFDGSKLTTFDVSENPSNRTLYAKWDIITYNITYVLDDGTNSEDNPETYDIEDEEITLYEPTKKGYTFKGWYTTSTFEDDPITTIYGDDIEDKTIYAKWYVDDYSISYELNGGTNSAFNPDSYSYDDFDITLSNPTRTGYTFIGWYTDEDFSGNEVTTISVSTLSDLVLYAKWYVNDYTISYDLNGGTTEYSNPDSYTIEDSNIELTSLSKTGYTFVGWYTSSDFSGELVTEIDTSECSNITLYAKFEINSYTISFNTNGGTSVDTITADYLEDISNLEPISVKTGYTFKGWYTDSTLTDEYTFDTMGLSNIILYASWSTDSYTITFDSNGGSTVHSIFADYLEDISSLSPLSTRTGYTFNGWYTDSILKDEYIFDTMDCEDITLYANWIINSYTITFDSNVGSSVDSITSEYGSLVSKPTDPTLSGYAFAGWYTDSDLTESYEFDTMDCKDITLYAKWVIVYTSDDTTISGDVTDLSSILSNSELLDLVSIKIVVNTNTNNIDSSDKSLIEDFITSMNNSNIDSYYLNITVYGISSDNKSYEVIELQSQTTLTISVDDDFTGYSNYGIIRCHDGETEELESTYDSDTNTITFSSNEFSTYSIYYFNNSDIATTDTATSSLFAYNVSYISALIIFMFGLLLILLFKIASEKSAYSSDRRVIISNSNNNYFNSKEYYMEQIRDIKNEIRNNLRLISLNMTGSDEKYLERQRINDLNNKIKRDNELAAISKEQIKNQIVSLKKEINNNLRLIKQNLLENKTNPRKLSKKELKLNKKCLKYLNKNKF